jgi:hypothetical protein
LDFLGFSRLNQDFSMGYKDKMQEAFVALFPPRSGATTGASPSWRVARQNCSWGKLSLISAFLQ